MKISIAILLLFICLACNAQTDSTIYHKVDKGPVVKNPTLSSKALFDCIDKGIADSITFIDCKFELTISATGKASDIKILSTLSPCIENVCNKAMATQVFEPAVLNGKPVPTRPTITYRLYTKSF
ncbi:MAG: energy transducer TonB [Sphingobacteriales bacterium JAD_PAG50586_3]|nr:MAG: energy transducer TonB [Sphingobacteriales bacterium JAD_PAG50586_3]